MSSRSMFNDGLSVFITKIAVIGLSILSVVIQANALGPAGRGVLAMLLIYPQLFTSIAEGGMRQATVYYVGRQSISDSRIFGASVTYTVVSALIFSSLIYFLLATADDYEYTWVMMLAAALFLPINLFQNAIRGMLLGKQQIKQFNSSQWLQKIMLVAMFALLWAFNLLTVETAIVCMVLSLLLGFVPAMRHFFKTIFTHMEFDRASLWAMIKKGSVYAAALFLIEANYKIAILLLGSLSTKEEIGLYAVATQVGELLWQLPAAVGLVVFSRSANDRDPTRWYAELARSIRISLWLTLGGGLALAVIAPFLFKLCFGDEFARSVSMTLWLLPGLVLMVVFKLLNMDLAGKGKPFVSLFIMLPALGLNVGLNYLLIPTMGGNGAAIAATCSYILAALAMLTIYTRMHSLSALDFVLIRPDDVRLLVNKFASKFPALRREV
ncbi:MAG TPA: polysaccharide biosynthesis C-terminal domain-containing protein [Dongiaceae bacterium]|nr:polysaccharide biosynthesis C-terminal domain-containing protein [Dongiaceae bacterium]